MLLRSVVFATCTLLVAHRLPAQQDRAEALQNPFSGRIGAIAAGKRLYDSACVNCHGTEARGDRGPALTAGDFKHGSADGEIFINIRSGIRGTEMPPFAQLTTE